MVAQEYSETIQSLGDIKASREIEMPDIPVLRCE